MTKLDELEALLAKATPGPWARCHDTVILAEDGFTTVCGVSSDDIGTGDDISCIAALRNIAPKLIAVARASKAVADEQHTIGRDHVYVVTGCEVCDALLKALDALEEP